LSNLNLIGNLHNSCKTRRALAVDSVDGGPVRNASVEGCHTGSRSSSTRRENVPRRNILDELRIEVYSRISRAEDMGEIVGFGVLETTLLHLGIAEALSSCCSRTTL
jgi:hypothetical protein